MWKDHLAKVISERTAVSLIALFLAGPAPLQAQIPEPAPTFQVGTNLVLIPFHVLRDSHNVDNLTRADLVLLEDGVPRQPSFLEGGRSASSRTSLDLALVFDTAGGPSIEWNPDAIYSFLGPGYADPLRSMLGKMLDGFPGLRLSVYRMRAKLGRGTGDLETELLRLSAPTRDVQAITGTLYRLPQANPAGERIALELPPHRKARPDNPSGPYVRFLWLYESLIAVTKDAVATAAPQSTQALLVFSTGLSRTNSTPDDAAAVARQYDVPIYPVMFDRQRWYELLTRYRVTMASYNASLGGRRAAAGREPVGSMVDKQMQSVLDDMDRFGTLGRLTGGRSFDYNTVNLAVLREILDEMQTELESQYVAGFAPHPADGRPRPHKLEIKLASRQRGKVSGGVRTVAY